MPMTISTPSLLLFLAHEHVHVMPRVSLSWHCTDLSKAATQTLLIASWAKHICGALSDILHQPCNSSMLQPLSHLHTSLLSPSLCQSVRDYSDADLLCLLGPAEEEKAAAEAEAAVAAREATPEVSEEGEIPVDPEEMEALSKAQQPAPKAAQQQSPSTRHTNDRARDRASDRDRGPAGRDRQAHSHTLQHCHYSHSQCTACLVSCHLHGCLVNAAGNGFLGG